MKELFLSEKGSFGFSEFTLGMLMVLASSWTVGGASASEGCNGRMAEAGFSELEKNVMDVRKIVGTVDGKTIDNPKYPGFHFTLEKIAEDGEFPPAHSREEFCEKSKDPKYFKALLYDRLNRPAVPNLPHGGWLRTGLCWWHSDFLRGATYLSVFKPDLPKPSREEGQRLIQEIMTKRGVVEVPGYKNLYEFTKDYADYLDQSLSAQEITSSVFELGFLRGLIGSRDGNGMEDGSVMDKLYSDVGKDGDIAFQVQLKKGIKTHSWLVIDMTKTPTGYDFTYLDPNYVKVGVYKYRRGDKLSLGVPLTPHTYGRTDLKYMKRLRDQYCALGVTSVDKRDGVFGTSGN